MCGIKAIEKQPLKRRRLSTLDASPQPDAVTFGDWCDDTHFDPSTREYDRSKDLDAS
jgi:hypothetical protein